jgi:hypothetical protein
VVKATLNDAQLQAVGFLNVGQPYAQGGLRGGFLRGSIEGRQLVITLHKVVFVPGVTVTGRVSFGLGDNPTAKATVTVSGSQAAHGKLTLTPGHYRGTLDGKSVKAKLTSADATPQLDRVPLTLEQINRYRAWARLRAPGF